MTITEQSLTDVLAGDLSPRRIIEVQVELGRHPDNQSAFNTVTTGYWIATFLVMSAFGWYVHSNWDELGGLGILLVSSAYALTFFLIGWRFWTRHDHHQLGGLLITCSVSMVPLMIYGFQKSLGIWYEGDPGPFMGFHHHVNPSWFTMEAGTILVVLAVLRFVKFPFLTFVGAMMFWGMVIDLLSPHLDGEEWTSISAGLPLLALAYVCNFRSSKVGMFWVYLVGLSAFCSGLAFIYPLGEPARFLRFLVYLSLIATGLFLRRKMFVVFGCLGGAWYVWHLAEVLYHGELIFMLVLSAVAVAVFYLTRRCEVSGDTVRKFVDGLIPGGMLQFRP